MHVIIHNLLLTKEDKLDYHIYSIEILRNMTINCNLLQIPEGYFSADVEAHGCIHLGGFAPH
jgi:hypothetical protein